VGGYWRVVRRDYRYEGRNEGGIRGIEWRRAEREEKIRVGGEGKVEKEAGGA